MMQRGENLIYSLASVFMKNRPLCHDKKTFYIINSIVIKLWFSGDNNIFFCVLLFSDIGN